MCNRSFETCGHCGEYISEWIITAKDTPYEWLLCKPCEHGIGNNRPEIDRPTPAPVCTKTAECIGKLGQGLANILDRNGISPIDAVYKYGYVVASWREYLAQNVHDGAQCLQDINKHISSEGDSLLSKMAEWNEMAKSDFTALYK